MAGSQSLVEVCQAILDEVGVEASITEAEAWVKANRPGWRYNRNSLKTTLTWLRKVLRGGDAGGELTAGDLVRAAQASQPHGGPRALRRRVEEVLDLCKKFGDTERLLRCLQHLERLE